MIDECEQDVNAYLEDTEGNKSLTYLLAYNGGNDNDDVLNYLVSKGSGDANDISKGRLDKKYDAPALLNGCKKGTLSLEDAKVLIGECDQDVNAYLEEGKDCDGYDRTPLMAAAENEHFEVVKYLLEQGEADPNIADRDGWNALHYAAHNNKKDTELIELLLTNMSLNSINKKAWGGKTPLDKAYNKNESPIKQKIIDLIRSKGGKRKREL